MLQESKPVLAVIEANLIFTTDFVFEFSGNGEDSNQGQVKMVGLKVQNIDTPAYRVE